MDNGAKHVSKVVISQNILRYDTSRRTPPLLSFCEIRSRINNRRNGIELGLTSTFHSLTTSPERIRMHIAVIGCGYWGPNHIRSFQGVTDCRVTAVDPDPSRLAEMSKRFFGLGLEAETERIFSDPDVNAVVI